jgi:hypothetical protein
VVNRMVGGWNVTGLVVYDSGQPFQVSAPNPYYPQWGNLYPDFNLHAFTGAADPTRFPSVTTYIPTTVASTPPAGQLGQGPPAISALRCPGQANENASILKNVRMGSDGQYRLSFRAEFYNLFNRHYYNINGCGGSHSSIGASNFGQISGVADNPRNGQFAIRFDF